MEACRDFLKVLFAKGETARDALSVRDRWMNSMARMQLRAERGRLLPPKEAVKPHRQISDFPHHAKTENVGSTPCLLTRRRRDSCNQD
jgi:hypothetical protein